MSKESEADQSKKNISVRVSTEQVDDLDRSIKKAQIEGEIPMDVSRAKVIRGLMTLASEDTDLIAAAVEIDE